MTGRMGLPSVRSKALSGKPWAGRDGVPCDSDSILIGMAKEPGLQKGALPPGVKLLRVKQWWRRSHSSAFPLNPTSPIRRISLLEGTRRLEMSPSPPMRRFI